ncbi:MAG: putative glycolipid-binding domain-containing protein [Gemmatimonadales bacterium]|nr:putative glycolipid-binding domain-containing protein [Gemmatimonadales bacterium]
MWRKLNTPGHDAATFSELEGGAELRGRRSSMATLARLRSPPVRADAAWYSTEGTVEGWCGSRRVKLRLRRARDGTWTSNGALCAAVTGCVDLDLSFTRLRICCR